MRRLAKRLLICACPLSSAQAEVEVEVEVEFEQFHRIEDAKPSAVEQHFFVAIEQVR